MKKLIILVFILISLALCRFSLSTGHAKPAGYKTPSQYYSARTNDFMRIVHALKLDPSDIYVSYGSFITR